VNPSSVSVESTLAVTGMVPVDTVSQKAPESQDLCQEPPSNIAAVPEIPLPYPMAFEDISSDSDYDIVEDAQLEASENRGTLTDLEDIIRDDLQE